MYHPFIAKINLPLYALQYRNLYNNVVFESHPVKKDKLYDDC